MTAAEIVLNAARMLLPVREAGANRGRFVEAIIRFAGGVPGDRGVRDGDGVVANVRDPKGPTRYAYLDWEAM